MEKKRALVTRILNSELRKYNLTIESPEILDNPEWYRDYTMTIKEYKEWRKESLEDIKKTLRCGKKWAEREMDWLDFAYGLKIEEDDKE